MKLRTLKNCLIMSLILTAVLSLSGISVESVKADEKMQTLVFAWDQPELNNLKQWEMHWGLAAGGPYTHLATIQYDGSGGTSFESPVDASVVGQAGTHETRYFVLKACGDIPQEDGSTKYECSDPSNEISHAFWIPAGGFSAPVQFRILSQ